MSTVAPALASDKRIVGVYCFYDSWFLTNKLGQFLSAPVNNNSVKREILEELNQGALPCAEAFNSFLRNRGMTAVPTVDQFDTIVVAIDPQFNSFFSDLRAILASKVTGKQQPSSGMTKNGGSVSTGDPSVNDDAVLSFVKLVPRFIQKIAAAPSFSTMVTRFGFKYVAPKFVPTSCGDGITFESVSIFHRENNQPNDEDEVQSQHSQ